MFFISGGEVDGGGDGVGWGKLVVHQLYWCVTKVYCETLLRKRGVGR